MRHRIIVEFETEQSAAFERIQQAWVEAIRGIGGAVRNVVIATSESRMTFLDAMAHQRPMRRKAWLARGPVPPKDEANNRILVNNTWMYPRFIVEKEGETCWININTGNPLSLCRIDYEASDWEVMG